jgi:hypothetical protein
MMSLRASETIGSIHAKSPQPANLCPRLLVRRDCYFDGETWGREDVKKLISRSFRDFSFEPKCIPTSQRSLLGHPGAAFLRAQFSQQLKINFSHLPVAVFF